MASPAKEQAAQVVVESVVERKEREREHVLWSQVESKTRGRIERGDKLHCQPTCHEGRVDERLTDGSTRYIEV